jgi:hypothetical protein
MQRLEQKSAEVVDYPMRAFVYVCIRLVSGFFTSIYSNNSYLQ